MPELREPRAQHRTHRYRFDGMAGSGFRAKQAPGCGCANACRLTKAVPGSQAVRMIGAPSVITMVCSACAA